MHSSHSSAPGPTPSTPPALSWDETSFSFDGRREFLISGEIHYARAPREEWAGLLDRSRDLGLNCIASYIFWNWHEPHRDVYDFSGDRDLGYFLSLCAERGLRVMLRVGPYCCAEWNYGGFPPYLRDEPGVKIRTWNEPYMARVEKFFTHLFAEIVPFLATKGGPVALVQVENEYANVGARYGEDGIRYNVWMAELARRLGADVPLIMCESGAEIPDVISTVNGFSISSERIARHLQSQPGVPVFWTELWPGWYDTWGYQTHIRDPRNIAYHLLDFIGNGGSGWNYYMWYGGTNFGRTSMYLQTTRYDFGAPLDEHGAPTLKAAVLARLHRTLISLGAFLLEGTVERSANRVVWSRDGRTVILERDAATLQARLVDGDGHVLFDTEESFQEESARFDSPAWEDLAVFDNWRTWPEPLPSRRSGGISSGQPVEQLLLTRDESDYTWYSTQITVDKPGEARLFISHGGDVLNVFLDGEPVARTQPPFLENRGPTTTDEARPMAGGVYVNPLEIVKGQYAQTFRFPVKPGVHRLEILAASLGLIKGDWMVSGPMETERKGIWGEVLFNDEKLTSWEMHPKLEGERLSVAGQPDTVPWSPMSAPASACTWYETTFELPASLPAGDVHYRLDTLGLGKGMLLINGHAPGRHWLIEGHGYGADLHWHEPETNGLTLGPEGEPTQRYLRIPAAWLKTTNRLVLFDEQMPSDPRGLRLQMRKS